MQPLDPKLISYWRMWVQACNRAWEQERKSAYNPSADLMDLHRLSGLSLDELNLIFRAKPHTMCSWASGKPMYNSADKHLLSQLLMLIRKVDRGSAAKNLDMLFEEHENHDSGEPFFLLVHHKFDEFAKLVGDGPGRPELRHVELSPEAQEARRPTPPEAPNRRDDATP